MQRIEETRQTEEAIEAKEIVPPIQQPPSQPPQPTSNQLYQALCQADSSNFKLKLDTFIKHLVDCKSPQHNIRFDFFVENNILKYLLETLRKKSYSTQYFEAIFHNLQVLVQNISSANEKLYLVSYLHKEGYFEEKYPFHTEEEVSYFILILRSLVRRMLLEEKDFINLFINSKEPHFPVLYNAMKFYNHPESHVITASRYILLELAAANFLYLKQTYFINFPFVTYYAQMAWQLKILISKSIKQDQYEKFLLTIMFLEEFVGNNDWESINMYANSLFAVPIRALMRLLLKDNKVKVLKFIEIAVSKIKIEKVLWGLRKLFFSEIESRLLKYLESPEPAILSFSETFKPTSYLDSYMHYIKNHCSSLFTQNYKAKNDSIIFNIWRSSASYLVYNQKGLEAELNKISDIIGVQIELNIPIDHYKPLKQSYIGIFQQQQTMSNNPYFKAIVIQCSKSQVCYFHFVKILIQLKILNEHLVFNPTWHLSLLSDCLSVSPIKLIYKYLFNNYQGIKEVDLKLKVVLEEYHHQCMQKIISHLLEEGWGSLKTHGGYLSEPYEGYQTYIFRGIECDIAFLMVLNLLLKNEPMINASGESYKEETGRKTRIIEKIVSSFDSEMNKKIFIRFNCQYLEILSETDDLMESIQPTEYKICQDPSCAKILEFISEKSKPFTLYFSNEGLANYVFKTLNTLRSKVREYEHELENIHFDIL